MADGEAGPRLTIRPVRPEEAHKLEGTALLLCFRKSLGPGAG